MKKLFAFVLALTAVVAVNAKQVVFDFTNPTALGITAPEEGKGTDLADGQTIVVDGVTMGHEKIAKTATRIWNSKGAYDFRIYADSKISFTAEEDITAIEFEGTVGFSEITGKTWSGSAKSVTLTANTTNKITKVTVFIGEKVDVWTADTVTVAGARALIDAKDAHDHFVKGIVATQPFNTFSSFDGRVSLYLVDDLLSTDSLQAYQVYAQNNAKWESLEAAIAELRIGDTVLVYAGGLKLYEAKKIYEIDPGYYAEKIGANPNPPEVIIPQLDTLTVAEAVELGKKLPAAKSNNEKSKEVVVKGFVVKANPAKEGFNDQTWYMADEPGVFGEFEAYQCTRDREVVEGDYVYVRGQIVNFGDAEKSTIEISKGSATHGEAPVIETVSVDVAKALEIGNGLADNAYTNEYYAVTGYVTKAFEFDEENLYQNFYMADKADDYGDFYAFKAKPEAPVEAGYKVILTGKIKKYVKDSKTTIEIENGKVEVLEGQGIENVVLTEKAQKVVVDGVLYIIRDNKMYDVRGTQVR